VVYFLVFFYVVFPAAVITVKHSTFHNVFNAQTKLVKETQAFLEDVEKPVNVFFINVPSPLYLMALQFAFDYHMGKGTTRVFPLIMRREMPEVEVAGEHTLVLSSPDEPFLESVGERVFMSTTDVVNRTGRTWTNEFFEARVEKLVNGGILALRFDFATPLQDDSMRFFYVNMQDRHVYPFHLAGAEKSAHSR